MIRTHTSGERRSSDQELFRRSVQRWTPLAAAMLLACSAPAQSNSMLKLRRAPASAAPASQPALPGMVAAGPAIRPPYAAPSLDDPGPANPALAAASPIAVEVPKPTRIGVHDLVTIIVREDKKFITDSKLQSEKEWKVNSAFEQWFRLDPEDRLVPQNFERAGPPGVKFNFKNEYDGQGKVNRQDSLITRIQAEVIDVKPNGNLVLQARKQIGVDEELQTATLTGVCRSKDITAQNTVLSTQVADAQIVVSHSGAARDASRRGWLMRVFDLLRPI